MNTLPNFPTFGITLLPVYQLNPNRIIWVPECIVQLQRANACENFFKASLSHFVEKCLTFKNYLALIQFMGPIKVYGSNQKFMGPIKNFNPRPPWVENFQNFFFKKSQKKLMFRFRYVCIQIVADKPTIVRLVYDDRLQIVQKILVKNCKWAEGFAKYDTYRWGGLVTISMQTDTFWAKILIGPINLDWTHKLLIGPINPDWTHKLD